MATPELRHLFNLSLRAGTRSDIGQGPRGRRICVTLDGGSFGGARLCGDVLPGGADALLVDALGNRFLDVRLVLRTAAGSLVYMTYTGVLASAEDVATAGSGPAQDDASKARMKVSVRFETGAPELAWLNKTLALGVGTMSPAGPSYEVYELL